jgi:hypothetical protein
VVEKLRENKSARNTAQVEQALSTGLEGSGGVYCKCGGEFGSRDAGASWLR